jgi:hypothetical protein
MFQDAIPSIPGKTVLLLWPSHHCLVYGYRVYHKKVWTTTHMLRIIKHYKPKGLEWVNRWPNSLIARWWWCWLSWYILWSQCKCCMLPKNQTGFITDLHKMCSIWSMLD